MVADETKEIVPKEQQVTKKPADSTPPRSRLSRGEFLKVAALGLGVAAAGTGVGLAIKDAADWITGVPRGEEKESTRLSINMAEFARPLEANNPSVVTFDFERLKKYYPFLLDNREGGFVFVNKGGEEKLVELSFDDLDGKKVVFPNPNVVSVAKSNVPVEQYTRRKGYDNVKAGLVCEGNFSISFDRQFADKPLLSGEGLDRLLVFKDREGTAGLSYVEGLRLEGLNDYCQNGDNQDIPAPAYISADNTALFVEGVDIAHTPHKPESIDEVNSQLARGVISHTTGEKSSFLKLENTTIEGLLWDAVNTNGQSIINVKNCRFIQSPEYRSRRGAGIGATFNNNSGSIVVESSRIDYNKGVANFSDDERRGSLVNIFIKNSVLKVTQWATVLRGMEKARLEHAYIDLTNETSQILPPSDEFGWQDVPLGHVDIDLSREEGEKTLEKTVFRMSEITPSENRTVLMHIWGGQRAYDNPTEFVNTLVSSVGTVGMLDLRGIRARTYFRADCLQAVLTRALKEQNHFPTEVALVYKDGIALEKWGVIVDVVNGGPHDRRPSKIFWYQPLEESRGYQENPRYW